MALLQATGVQQHLQGMLSNPVTGQAPSIYVHLPEGEPPQIEDPSPTPAKPSTPPELPPSQSPDVIEPPVPTELPPIQEPPLSTGEITAQAQVAGRVVAAQSR